MEIVFTQILVILLYVLIGFAAGKAGLINPDQRKYLSGICSNLIVPFTVLTASSQSVSGSDLAYLAVITGFILLLFIMSAFVSMHVQALLHVPEARRVTTTSLITFPNCTFLGLPLCRALFGEIAVLYNAMAMVAFNVLFFTWQASAFTGKKFSFRNLLTAPTVATGILIVMLAFGWHFPDPVQTVVSNTGAMITPLSLIVIGVMMSENRLTAVLKERRAYLVTLFRNLVIPLIAMVPLRMANLEPASRVCLLVYLACPCAALSSIYAIQNNKEPEYAARTVLMTTVLFAFTLPVMIYLGTRFLQ